jgi:hypothetical protein
MKTAAAATLFAAVVLFGVYWLVAGPGMFGALKAKGLLRHSWLIFGGIVLVFSAITWMAAFFLRPGLTEIEHFSIVDIDTTSTGPALIRAQSYFSLFIPKHGTVDIAIDAAKDRPNQNTLSSPGLPGSDRSSFVDERRYTINTLAVGAAPGVPVRSTAKQFEAQYCDIIDNSSYSRRWAPPVGKLKLQYGWPSGQLTHNLPGTLTNVRVIYCEGDGATPYMGKYSGATDWAPGAALKIVPPEGKVALVVAPNKVDRPQLRAKTRTNKNPNGWEQRRMNEEGHLGTLVSRQSGESETTDETGKAQAIAPSGSVTVDRLEMMTFFNMLPPPDFMIDESETNLYGSSTTHLNRSVARTADLTHLTASRRVIIIGHLEKNSPIPVPITVEGSEPASSGWTMVRFVLPVED